MNIAWMFLDGCGACVSVSKLALCRSICAMSKVDPEVDAMHMYKDAKLTDVQERERVCVYE